MLTPTSPRLQGRLALVTGGASGIGAAAARRLAAEGSHVVVCDRDGEGAQKLAADVGGDAVVVDVTDVAAVRAAVAQVEETIGPIDVLVNNAGGDQPALFLDTDEAAWDAALALNLKSVIACTHAALGPMVARRTGTIVNVASEAGRIGVVGGAIYAAAKAGVIGLTRAVAREGARFNVRCNAVAPGPTETPLLDSLRADPLGARLRQAMIDATVLGRCGRPDEIAAAIAFLASDDASYVTGHTLAVSGGVSME
ncbi:MAG TPA: SDR family oxidoreductase [Acidimicrobiales bacterium]|nr:SDR family oxidoreductase [Acidimicrobiales bacterium]